MYMKISDKVLK